MGCYETQRRSESKGLYCQAEVRSWFHAVGLGASPARLMMCYIGAEQERTCWYPKDGELCLRRSKPEETLVEDRSDSDVQIDRQT